MDAGLAESVNFLYQQLTILQEFIQHKFGSEYKDFEQLKLSGPTSPTASNGNGPLFEYKYEGDSDQVEDNSPWGEGSSTTPDDGFMIDQADVEVEIEIPQNEGDDQEYKVITWDPVSLDPDPIQAGSSFGQVGHVVLGRPVDTRSQKSKRKYKSTRQVTKPPVTKGSCDYCGEKNGRNPTHILECHREMCVITKGADGGDVVKGYLCPRKNCSRKGRPLYNHYQVEVHLRWPCAS